LTATATSICSAPWTHTDILPQLFRSLIRDMIDRGKVRERAEAFEASRPVVEEEWRSVAGFESFYEVSNHGRVRSLPRRVERVGTRNGVLLTGRVRKLATNHMGYRTTNLRGGGRFQHFLIQRLVAVTFLPNPDNKEFVNHKDGDKANNVVTNLEWVTRAENNVHAYDNGMRKGANAHIYQSLLLGLTTFGSGAMARELRRRGYRDSQTDAVYHCVKAGCRHLGLIIRRSPLSEWRGRSVLGIDITRLIDLLVLWRGKDREEDVRNTIRFIEGQQGQFGLTDEGKSLLTDVVREFAP
jgi:hypothetical protein